MWPPRVKAPQLKTNSERFKVLREKDNYIQGSLENPPPGTYETHTAWGSRSFNLYQMYGVYSGRTAPNQVPVTPGPGEYRYIGRRKPAGGRLDKQRRFDQASGSEHLGPGSYDVASTLRKPSFNVHWRRK